MRHYERFIRRLGESITLTAEILNMSFDVKRFSRLGTHVVGNAEFGGVYNVMLANDTMITHLMEYEDQDLDVLASLLQSTYDSEAQSTKDISFSSQGGTATRNVRMIPKSKFWIFKTCLHLVYIGIFLVFSPDYYVGRKLSSISRAIKDRYSSYHRVSEGRRESGHFKKPGHHDQV